MRTYVAGTVFAVLLGLAGLAQGGAAPQPGLPTGLGKLNVETVGACSCPEHRDHADHV